MAPRARAAVSLAACLALVSLASCGGGEPVSAPSVSGPDAVAPGSLGGLRCSDWSEASLEEKRAILAALEEFAGGEVVGRGVSGRGNVLDGEDAFELLERRCAEAVATGFLLYKLYTHAAAFAQPHR